MPASTRLRSMSRSPGMPTATSCLRPSGRETESTTFLRVSAAVQGSPSRGCSSLDRATRVSIVGLSGVRCTCAGGASA